jgi:AmmeMemoRadiSam system protein A
MPAALSIEERGVLLRVARQSLEAALHGRDIVHPSARGALLGPGGAFVSLRRRDDDRLRGCVGWLRSERPLLETVSRMAVAAATRDGRFAPITASELRDLTIEISVLGPLFKVLPEEVEVGRHGLLIRHGGGAGVLLPQVAGENGWDRETFLEKTCEKGRLPAGAWRQRDAEILAFTAIVFGEDSP